MNSAMQLAKTFEELGHKVIKVNGKRWATSPKQVERQRAAWKAIWPGTEVWVVDAFCDEEGEAYVAVFANKGSAEKALAAWFKKHDARPDGDDNVHFAGVVKRKVRG